MGAGGEDGEDDPVTVLVAEDDDAFRETLAIWLRREDGWRVEEAADGQEALESLDGSVDALVLDRRMPERTGHDVVDNLDETDFEGPVVVISAYEPDSFLNETEVSAYLVKPIERADVETRLREHL